MVYMEFFSYLANITSAIAFLFSGYQFFQWRRQQRHSLELESILNMEDRYEILIASEMKLFGIFKEMEKTVRESHNWPTEERHRVDDWLKNKIDPALISAQNHVNACQTDYSLACFRVRRLGFDVDSTKEMSDKWISEIFISFIKNKNSIEQVVGEVSEVKKVVSEKFQMLRKF